MTSDTVQNPCASVALNMQSFADLSGMGPQAGNNKHARSQQTDSATHHNIYLKLAYIG